MTTIRTGELDADGLHKALPSSISTYLGGRIEPLNPNPDDIFIEDIARALSRTVRYGGHVGGFLSVARHCLWVADALAGTPLELAGLLHDAAEAYLGDMPRPLKQDPSMATFREADQRLDRVIAEKFGLPYPMAPEVAEADRRVLLGMEMPEPGGKRWTQNTSPDEDESEFLARYRRLTGRGTIVPASTQLVGLMGYAQSGKDTTGNVLVEEFGFTRVAFADALRDMLYALNPLVEGPGTDGLHELWPVRRFVDEYGWEYAKAFVPFDTTSPFTIRKYLQRLGTEAGRDVLGDDIWVRTALAKVKPGGRYVITDVRFPNEARAVVQAGGQLWRVVRPGTVPVNPHVSETALDGWQADQDILNFGNLRDLEAKVARARREMIVKAVG